MDTLCPPIGVTTMNVKETDRFTTPERRTSAAKWRQAKNNRVTGGALTAPEKNYKKGLTQLDRPSPTNFKEAGTTKKEEPCNQTEPIEKQ